MIFEPGSILPARSCGWRVARCASCLPRYGNDVLSLHSACGRMWTFCEGTSRRHRTRTGIVIGWPSGELRCSASASPIRPKSRRRRSGFLVDVFAAERGDIDARAAPGTGVFRCRSRPSRSFSFTIFRSTIGFRWDKFIRGRGNVTWIVDFDEGGTRENKGTLRQYRRRRQARPVGRRTRTEHRLRSSGCHAPSNANTWNLNRGRPPNSITPIGCRPMPDFGFVRVELPARAMRRRFRRPAVCMRTLRRTFISDCCDGRHGRTRDRRPGAGVVPQRRAATRCRRSRCAGRSGFS